MAFDPDAYLAEGGGVKETPFDPDSYLGIEKPEPREFFSFEDAVSAIGTIPEALAVGVPAAYQKLVTGLEIPEKSEAIESELAFQQRIQTEQEDRVASGKATTFGSAIREAVPSLGFSVLPMAAAIPAGIGGTMVGGPAAPVTGPAAAMAASGTVAYRMAGSDMMYRAYKQLEEAKGSPLTNEEKAEYYKTVLPIAQNYGLWEAGPEAVSNAITMGVGKFVFGFGKQAAKKLVGESIDSANKTIARKVAEKGAAVAGGLGAEIASEGVTAVGQYPEEAKIRQLAATGEVSKGEQPSYPGGYMQAVKDVAPATIALYGMMGTAAGGVKLSTLPFRSQKTPEQIAEDNINIEADRVSRELSIGETDEETKSINAALQAARNNLIAKKEVYTALEPNDPAAQSLGLEIREMEREVVALDNELKKRVGEPVSEPITEAERQQAELAKAFVEEAAGVPTVKEPLTVQPAQAAPVIEGLQAVSENTATPEQLTQLSQSGLVDIIKGQPVINEEGQAALTKAQAPLPALTPEERRAEIEAAPVEQVVTPPVEVAPTIAETAPITPAPVTEQAAPAEATAAPSATAPIFSEDYTGPRYTYGLRNRPLDMGTAPKGYIIGSNGPALGRARWGTIQYPRQLTKDEIYDYELEVMDELPAVSETITPAPEVAPVEVPVPENVLSEIKQYPDFYNRITSNQTLDVGDVNRYLAFRKLPKTIEAKVKSQLRSANVSEIESLVSELSQSNKDKAKFEASVKEVLTRKGESEKLDDAINEYDSAKYNLDDARAKRDNPLIGVKWERESLSRKVGDAQRRLQDVKKKLVDIASRTKPTPAVSETIAEPVQRDVTKPEQMTPQEWKASRKKAEGNIYSGAVSEYQQKGGINYAIKQLAPVSVNAVDEYGIKIPKGYTKQGELYVYQPAVSETITEPAEAPAPEVAPVEALTDDQAETIRDVITLRKSQGREPNPKQVKRLAEYDAKKAGVEVQAGDIVSNIVVGHPMFESPQPELNNLVPIKVTTKEQLASPIQRAQQVRDTAQSYIGNYQVEQAKAKTPAQKKAFAKKFTPSELARQRDILDYIKNDVMPELDRLEKLAPPATPAVSETITEQVPTEVSGKIKRGAKRRRMADRPTPLPENERYGQVKLNRRVQKYFGGKIPARVYVVDDAVDPEYEYKAAYYPDLGILILNNAFIKKNENIGDIIAHELGHYAFGDKKFKAAFDRFYNSLSPEEKVDVDNLMGDAYKKDTEESQMEERKVIAFTSYTIATPQRRTLWNAVLDAMKAFANKFLGKNFEFSDPTRTALAMLATAKKRFAAGEEIVREEEEAKKIAAQGMNARFAELEARAKAGDKEAEEEAQRMVDEAAREAGYNSPKVYHGSSDKPFNIFKTKRGKKGTREGGAFFTPTETLANFFATISQQQKYGGITDKPGIIYKAYLKMDKPVTIDQNFENEGTIEDKTINRIKAAKKYGFDGIIWKNTIEPFHPDGVDQYIVFSPEQIKSADPFTYDDAGNLIPLSERFQPSEPDIRRMAVEPRREQIMGEKVGPEVKTPEGIIAKTQELLRKQFDPSKVSENNTTEAFRAIGKLTSKQGNAFAEELNDLGRVEGSEVSMGAALFVNDLFEYSIRLAADGNKKMLGIMMSNINKLPAGAMGATGAGQTLRARLELSQRFLTMAQAEQDAYTNYVAEFIYGPNPTKEQIQSIKDAYAAVDKTPQVTEQELTDELESVGGRTGTDLVGKIKQEFTKATEKGKEQRKTEEEELDTEYKKVQKQADAEIEKLAKIQSDTPSFDPAAARQITNDVRAIVSTDLKQKPDMGRKAPWKSMLVAKLQEAGVELTAAETLADIVWRQHEINSLSRELSSINKAIEKGPISEIVKAIKDTPLEDQQNPNWRYEVMRDYLRRAGLNVAQSERIAKLMDISLQKRFTMAQEEAFTQAISKSAPWKTGDTRSRRAFQKVLQALRAGALDPARNVLSDMAALNGWTGFTSEQYKVLLKNDAILSDPKSADATKAEAHKAIQNIISKAKLPIRARDVIGQFYDAQALSGIPTITVNIFSPAGMAAKNTLTQAMNGVLTARPEQITASITTLIDSIKSWANTVAFSFKNNVTVYSNVEYLVNDEGLLKLYKRGVDQFKNGKTPRERADGVKNMMIGMMDYVRRVLNALDYGAIASLQNQAVSKYALAVMQAKGMSSKDGAKMLNAMMEQKRNFYNDQIAIGTDKNKAAVLADEFFVSAWRQALTDAKLPAQEVMDAALNDAMSAVGRNRQSLDAFREEETNTRDEGVLSFPAIWLLETMANAANKQDSQLIKIFSRIIYGFAVIPARVFRETAWFSPYGAVRFAYDAIAKKMGKTSPYAQSLGNDLQYRQRLTETIAGSIVFLSFLAAMSSSTEDEEDEKPFKIVVTGNGPLRSEDPQYYDSWTKKNKANTVSLYFGKTKFTINTMRGFEAFAWPAMMLGAVDDWNIRRKQKRETNTPAQMGDAAIVAGNVLSASLRRGPYSFAAKPLFEAYGDRGVESLVKSLAFPAKTLVPVLGASLARNISDFLNDPIDRRTLDGALWSNVPIIGPAVAPKSYNAFGEPTLANEASDKLFKLGIPITFRIPSDRQSVMLHELVLKQGGGPSIPTRNQLAQRIDRQPTNKEYERFVKDYGFEISEVMKENLQELSEMSGKDYDTAMEFIGNNARDVAEFNITNAETP